MEKLPILYYRKLKRNQKVWVPAMQMNITLELPSESPIFLGVTQYAWDGSCCFGYIETSRYPADAANGVELEVGEIHFADDKKYIKEEVSKTFLI